MDGPSSLWKSVVSEGHPLQTDNSSCGIMTLLYAWYLTRGDVSRCCYRFACWTSRGRLFTHMTNACAPSLAPLLRSRPSCSP